MRGVSELIKAHLAFLEEGRADEDFLAYHLLQIGFLQHERLVHLIVTLFVTFCSLLFLVLFLFLHILPFFALFILLLILTAFYIFHYFKLENRTIEWYFIYNERRLHASDHV